MKKNPSTKKKPIPILVSACLLGIKCRYDGASKPHAAVLSHDRAFAYIPFCPECDGGLPTPRPPAECQPDGRVVNREGKDVTAAYQKGAAHAVTICKDFNIHYAILKSKSPSCGPTSRYDGSFTRTLIEQPGIAAQALREAGITIFSENDFDASKIVPFTNNER